MQIIRDTFKPRVATIDLTGKHHSTLAGDFNATAFADVVTYLKVRLGLQSGPAQMQLASFEGSRCVIDAEGWKAR